MSKTKVIVRTHPFTHPSSDQSVMISEMVVRRWKIPTDQHVRLRFGSVRQTVKVVPIASRNEIRISSTLASQLGLSLQNFALRLSYNMNSRTIRIGPLVGVMIPRITGTPGNRFGVITAFCRELADTCRMKGAFVYFFTPDDVRSTGDKIEGWTTIGQEYKSSFPIPDVIYNRLPSRKLDGQPGLLQFLKEAKTNFGTNVFNEKHLDKTEVFDALRSFPGAARYLPESHMFKGTAQLRTMCSRYRTVFLKPITGSLGKGIIRISKTMDGYQVASSSMAGAYRQIYPSMKALVHALAGKLKTGKYQIQQGLDLIAVGGRLVDFRALAQKNIRGEWAITSIVARVAGNDRFVSNVAQGGTVGTVKQTVAKSNLAVNRFDVASRLQQAAIHIARGIDAKIPHHFGELGIDLAVDRAEGRVWLLEVNSKPSKNDSSLLDSSVPNVDRQIRPSVKLLVQYFRYLARL